MIEQLLGFLAVGAAVYLALFTVLFFVVLGFIFKVAWEIWH